MIDYLNPATYAGLAPVVTAVVAVVTAVVALGSYSYQKKRDRDLANAAEDLKRFDKFQEFEKRYREDNVLNKVRKWIYGEQLHPDEKDPSDYEMQIFMGFFEEMALMINSKLVSENLAAYTIGIDAARFYSKVDQYRNERYWQLFHSFASRMQVRFDALKTKEIQQLRF